MEDARTTAGDGMNQVPNLDLASAIQAVATAGLMVSVCNIWSRPTNGDGSPVVDSSGQVDIVNLVPVSGLQNIPCMDSVQSPFRPNDGAVIRGAQQFDTLAEKHILLNGYYPTILQQYIAEVDGNYLEIFAVEPDSQFTMTRIAAKEYSL